MTLETYNETAQDLQHNANVVKDILFDALIEDKILTAEQAEKYVIVLHKKGYFGALLEKLWGSTDKVSFKVLKLR